LGEKGKTQRGGGARQEGSGCARTGARRLSVRGERGASAEAPRPGEKPEMSEPENTLRFAV
jgi:hypothetical protein